jgi:hypothetical protein
LKIQRKYVKLALSIAGPTVILVSFFANDSQREGLKELIDSIDSAENAYVIQMEDRTNHESVTRLTKEFEEFAAHPSSPIDFEQMDDEDFDTDAKTVDSALLDGIFIGMTTSDQLLINIKRLVDKLPPNAKGVTEYNRLVAVSDSVFKTWNTLDVRAKQLNKYSTGLQKEIDATNKEINDFVDTVQRYSENVESFSGSVLKDADRDREEAEHERKIWTFVFRGLYVLGWSLGITGIIMGEEVEQVIEDLSEAS